MNQGSAEVHKQTIKIPEKLVQILLEAAVVQALLLQVPLPVEEFAACADNISGNTERMLLLATLNLLPLYYQKYSTNQISCS